MVRKTRVLPDQSELKRIFTLDADLGVLLWKRRDDRSAQWNGRFEGKIVGGPTHKYGYWVMNMDGYGPVLVHRLIWKLVHGVDAEFIDHIDGDPSNNRLSNLRSASRQDNMRNKKPHVGKKLPKGVSLVSGKEDTYRATIYANKRSVHLGCFSMPDEAHAAYVKAAKEQFGEFARLD
nr:HNH endonuclease [Brucella intermedia]